MSCETAVISCAGANGLASMMLPGTALEVQSAALGAAHIDDWQLRFHFPDAPGHFPAVEPAQQVDIGDERTVYAVAGPERNCLLAGGRNGGFKPPVIKSFLDQRLDSPVVFNDHDDW